MQPRFSGELSLIVFVGRADVSISTLFLDTYCRVLIQQHRPRIIWPIEAKEPLTPAPCYVPPGFQELPPPSPVVANR